MEARFKASMLPEWSISSTGITFKKVFYPFEKIAKVVENSSPNNSLTNGVIEVYINGTTSPLLLAYPFKEKGQAKEAIKTIQENCGDEEQKLKRKEREERESIGLIYDLQGVRGRSMKVYDDRVVISVKAGAASFLTGNASDGEKTIFYTDCVGVQFKESGIQIGYLQLETASGIMNMKQSNFFNENSFTFDTSVQSNEKMREVADYVRGRVNTIKKGATQKQESQISLADEIKKFKELLDMGAITQEEFDAKKKQLLGL